MMIKSMYNQCVETYDHDNKLINKHQNSWGVQINKDDADYIICEIDTEKVTRYKSLKKQDISRVKKKVQNLLRTHFLKFEKLNVKPLYQETIDISYRTFTKRLQSSIVEKKIIYILVIKYIRNRDVLLLNSYSNDLNNINFETLEVDLKSDYKKILKLSTYKKHSIMNFEYLVLSPYIAGLASHELFGHSLEVDNYERLNLDKKNWHIPWFINVSNDSLLDLSGYCTFDDFGHLLARKSLIREGEVVSLIGSKENLCFRAGKDKAIPRLTNTVVSSTNTNELDINQMKKKLTVESLIKAKFENGKVILDCDACYLSYDNETYYIGEKSLQIDVIKGIEAIKGFYGKTIRGSSIDCIKKGNRCGGVGFVSAGMVIEVANENIKCI